MKEKFNSFMNWCKANKAKASGMLSLALLFVMGITANAEGATGNVTSGMTTAMTGAFESVQADVTSIISAALPPALAIMGIIIAIMVGIRFFKRTAK